VSNTPKDNPENKAPEVKPIDSPAGVDLHPKPRESVRISKRAGVAIGAVVLGLLLAFAYGAYRRQISAQATARDSGLPKGVQPATASARDVEKDIPTGNAPLVRNDPNQLQPPDFGKGPQTTASPSAATSCGFDPHTGEPYRFNPETGQPCAGYPPDRIVVRQPATSPPQTAAPGAPPEPTPEERRLAAAYQREREAMIAPTAIGSGSAIRASNSFAGASAPTSSNDDITRVAALSRAIADRTSTGPGISVPGRTTDSEYDSQNMQTTKASFLASNQQQKTDDYLRSIRTAPMSAYEIKAGWEVPAVLEQSLNSDLPGDIKALISSNVFDTATGRYLLIPQGARLVGKYDSRIAYGQDGVQVVWDRIMFPDASSIDINGMVGLDAHGNSGLRYDVDHHYKRLFGFAALTSAFTAAFDLSQRNTQTALTYPSVSDTATAAVGQELSQTGAMITRRNLNVQPTIKVPAGYKFTVRVNRDILFDAPYHPVEANPLPLQPPGQLHQRTSFSTTGRN
jgi:type IV secretory pathway VirB10-like protein